ncbi:MAG: hypothetical protein JSR17_05570 [Proteobacteria bacterium]|nr:hypothetical protein [Pseudomonadota bacterium]
MHQGPDNSNQKSLLPAFNNLTISRRKGNKVRKARPAKQYFEIDGNIVDYYNGAHFEYFKEYNSRKLDDNWISFPLDCCDPLPLHSSENIRFFYPSAQIIPGYSGHACAVQVLDDSIKQVYVVRGKDQGNGHRSHVYIGIDTDNFELMNSGAKKVYNAKILLIQSKDTKHTENEGYLFIEGVKNLDGITVGQAIRPYLIAEGNFNAQSPAYLKLVKELFADKQEGAYYHEGMLLMRECYWTQDENKLKGITYRSRAKLSK